MRSLYTPAIDMSTLDDEWNSRPVNWMDPRGKKFGCYYPNALLSYAYWKNERVEFPRGTYVFGDSGGFSIATRGAVIHPVACLSWQMANTDEGPILDRPPLTCAGQKLPPGTTHKTDFRRALNRTLHYIRTALPTYLKARESGSDFRWWGAVHGQTLEELEEWYRAIAGVYPFEDEGEGWALKGFPQGSPSSIARVLRFCEKKGFRRIHVFAPGGPPATATLLSLGPRVPVESVSFDNSSPIRMGNNRALIIPSRDGLSFTTISEKPRETRGRDRKCRDYMLEKCRCPSCDFLREDVEKYPEILDRKLSDKWSEYLKHRMIFCNTLAVIRTVENQKVAAQLDPKRLRKALLGRKEPAVVKEFLGGGAKVK